MSFGGNERTKTSSFPAFSDLVCVELETAYGKVSRESSAQTGCGETLGGRMRLVLGAILVLFLITFDQATTTDHDAVWTGSMGRLVVDGRDPSSFAFTQQDGTGGEQGRMSSATVDGVKAGSVLRLETLGLPKRIESLQARIATTSDIDAGSRCWLRFEARASQPQIELNLARLLIGVHPKAVDGEPLLDQTIFLEPSWQPINLAFSAATDFDAGDIEIMFAFGAHMQLIDIKSLSLRCFDDERMMARLPMTAFSYAGREADAPWRDVALGRIDRYRKGDLTVDVKDSNGEPVTDAEIHIQMSRHAFSFGATIDPVQLTDGDRDERAGPYRRLLKELFNMVTLDEGLRWADWEKPDKRRAIDDALAWVRSLGLDLRARGLVPTTFSDLPQALQEQGDDPGAMREDLRTVIGAIVSEFDGDVQAWDVVDRPWRHQEVLDLVGWEEVVTWFRLARSAAPNARLALNESDILAGDRMAELGVFLGDVLKDDTPIDRIGMQAQFKTQPPPIQVLNDRLDQLASFDLPLVVTAFDIMTDDPQLQQDFARDFLTLAFSHPSVEGFVFGRFWEDETDTISAFLYRADGTITPIGDLYRKLVLEDWWTDVVALSNAKGQLVSRVFHGDYTVSARKGSLSSTATLRLGPDGARVELILSDKDDNGRTL